ncbi:MAG TPA: NAD(P)H-dependent oxidoreductase [Ktedonobacterales bacterium]|nr:NAD(P)H-dependent oxidoreductase [Ktedonobacterales bacterium]
MRPIQNVQIIIGSARDERQGERVAQWLTKEIANSPAAAEMAIEVIDLRDWPLPFFNEHPASGKLDDTIVGEWMRKVAEADAYIIVAPEFNHSFTGALKNALDYGYRSWRDKPVAFVGYGGDVVGGARAVEQLRLVAIELQMAPIRNAIYLPGVRGQFDERGALRNPQLATKVAPLVEQLFWWSRALQAARQQDEAAAEKALAIAVA